MYELGETVVGCEMPISRAQSLFIFACVEAAQPFEIFFPL